MRLAPSDYHLIHAAIPAQLRRALATGGCAGPQGQCTKGGGARSTWPSRSSHLRCARARSGQGCALLMSRPAPPACTHLHVRLRLSGSLQGRHVLPASMLALNFQATKKQRNESKQEATRWAGVCRAESWMWRTTVLRSRQSLRVSCCMGWGLGLEFGVRREHGAPQSATVCPTWVIT